MNRLNQLDIEKEIGSKQKNKQTRVIIDSIELEVPFDDYTKPDYIKELTKVLKETFDKGGNVVIPSFAVGRTQEMLYYIKKLNKDSLTQCEQDLLYKNYIFPFSLFLFTSISNSIANERSSARGRDHLIAVE